MRTLEDKRGGVPDEVRVRLTAVAETWENGVIYTERCSAVLDIGEGYLRFKLGKTPCTIWGSGLEILSYQDNRLLARGEVERIDFG